MIVIWIIHFSAINFLLLLSILIKKDKVFIVGSLVYSIFVFGQRWMTGVDFPGYLLYYLIDFNAVEPGFYFLQNVLASNNLYFGILIFVAYALTIFNFYKLVLKTNVNVKLMIYMYSFLEIYFIQMSQIRQGIAIGFFINAFFYAYKKDHIKLILNTLLAISFHISVVAVVPFLFIRPHLTKKTYFYLLIVLIILPFFDITFLINILGIDLYANYIDSVYDVPLGVSHYLRFYISLFGSLIYIYNLKNIKKDDYFYCIANGHLVYLFLYALSFKYAPVFRLSNYLKMYEVLFFVYNLDNVKKLSKKTLTKVIAIVVIFLYSSVALLDPYDISRYEFRSLRLREEKSTDVLFSEINRFYLE